MQFVVAYDSTPISRTALARAVTLADGVGGDVTAVTVIPRKNAAYASQRGWLSEGTPWDRESVLSMLAESVRSVSPGAEFAYRMADRYAPRGAIGRLLRTTAEEAAVDVLVVGSESAGRVLTTLTTVTQSITGGTYDLYLVRESDPTHR